MEEMLHVEEVATLFGVTNSTVNNWRRSGRLPAVKERGKVGNPRWLYPKPSVLQFLAIYNIYKGRT